MAAVVAKREVKSRSATDPPRVRLFGISIDHVTMTQAVDRILHWTEQEPSDTPCRCVVTPNVDHIVKLRSNEELRAAYQSASLVVADGWPIVSASRWLGKPLPERVAGSDLVPALFDAASKSAPLRIFLLGAAEGVGQRAADAITHRWPHVTVCGVHSPPFGFEREQAKCAQIEEIIRDASPDLLIIGLGAPKQELWMHASRDRLAARVAIGAGATIDFLAGEQRRAPRWAQRYHLEWLYRAASQPRRLAGRYLKDIVIFPWICLEEWVRPESRSGD